MTYKRLFQSSQNQETCLFSPQHLQHRTSSPQPSHALTTAEDTLDYQEEEYGEYEQYQENQQYHHETNLQAKGCQFQDPSELLQFVHRSPDDNKFYCTLCDNFSHQNSSCARNHVESQHYPNIFSYPCDLCEQIFDSRNKYNNHKRLKHKKMKQF